MTRNALPSSPDLVNRHGANALLAAIISFLRTKDISKEFILDFVRQNYDQQGSYAGVAEYRKLLRAYEDMGILMSTWFSEPKFLDNKSSPVPVTTKRGPRSVSELIRMARVKISATMAAELMRRSPSVSTDSQGRFRALRRVFVLPEFEVPRAALIVERYLDTLRKNSTAHMQGTTLLLERNCHVPEIDLNRVAPILRDIKGRGTAFMDSVDGDIESYRHRRSKRHRVGELGVLVFAWTRPSRSRTAKPNGSTTVRQSGFAAERNQNLIHNGRSKAAQSSFESRLVREIS